MSDDLVSLKAIVDVYNYADDNTVGVCDRNYAGLQIKLRQVGNEMLQWFDIDIVQANPYKFQYIMFSKCEETRSLCLNAGVILQPQECVKVLGINIDTRIDFDQHIMYLISLKKKSYQG